MAGLFQELKRRNVVRVGVAYVIVGWVVVQICQVLFEAFGTPDWVIKTVIVLIGIGFPFALLFAWAFEMTPDGIKKTRDVDVATSITPKTGQKLNYVIIAALVVALFYFIWERQAYDSAPIVPAEPVADVTEEAAQNADEPVVAETISRSIAVLPFVNMSSDADQGYFADGLTEEILNSLAKTPDLLVASRTSSFGFKGSTQPVQEIASLLGVDHILEGSVRRGGDKLRITAQLIRANDGFHLWSETFDRTMDDIIAIQEEIAVQIAKALNTAMDPEALAEMMSAGTSSVAAYEAYLTGQGAAQASGESGDPYDNLKAMESWEQAIELDPEFSAALGRLSLFWTLQMASNQLSSGITDLTFEEMRALRDDLLDRAILHEKDDVTRLGFEGGKALNALDFRRALRLFREHRERRTNDNDPNIGGLLYTYDVLGLRKEQAALIKEVYEQTELTRSLANQFAQRLRRPEDADLMRVIGHEAAEKFSNDALLNYQIHRLLLWAGDIDGASQMIPVIESSDLPEENFYLVNLRQACAEKRLSDALTLHNRGQEKFGDDLAIAWLGLNIIGDHESADAIIAKLDEEKNFEELVNFMSYSHFDPSPYPNLMTRFGSQLGDSREIIDIPYRCNR